MSNFTAQSSNIQTITTDIYPTNGTVQREPIRIKATANTKPETCVEIEYSNIQVVGNGSFGVVYVARLTDGGGSIAIKKVLQDKRYKNRELQIMRKLEHPNVIKLKYYFYLNIEAKDELFLNLILDYMPDTLYRIARQYQKNRQQIPSILVRLYSYQMFRALAYIHSAGVCHRDIKPQNLLINESKATLKLCDFGSAKFLVPGEPNISYICSRYYRAPELIFGSTTYTNSIDVWSAGAVLAELMLDRPIFPGDSGVDQLVEIIKMLGTPTRDQIHQMNSNYREFLFPSIRARPWSEIFPPHTLTDAIDLVSKILEYDPNERLTPLKACAHKFYDELRNPDTRLPNGNPLPPLFNFSEQELTIEPSLNSILLPLHGIETNQIPSSSLTDNTSNIDCGITPDYHSDGKSNKQPAAS